MAAKQKSCYVVSSGRGSYLVPHAVFMDKKQALEYVEEKANNPLVRYSYIVEKVKLVEKENE